VNLTKGVGAKQEIRFRIARLEPADSAPPPTTTRRASI
jgi:hypothetical protein